MGAPASRRVWVKRSVNAVYVGTYADPAGMTACVFADPRGGRAIGPLNLRLGARTLWSFPAPRVGAPPDARPGRFGHLEYFGIEWEGHRKGPDHEPRGVFLRFEESQDSKHLPTLAADPLLLGLLGDARKIEALREPAELGAALWGLILGRHEAAAVALAARAGPEARAKTDLVFRGKALPHAAAAGYVLAPPGVLALKERERMEGYPEPNAGPFAQASDDPIVLTRAAGVDVWRALLRSLDGAREGEAIALGFDAAGHFYAAENGRIERYPWCADQAMPRFGDVLRLQLQEDRIGWAESLGRNEAAKVVDTLPPPLLARAAEEGHASWDTWERTMAVDADLREAVLVNPSLEHARRLERRLPGSGDGRRKLGAVLAVVAAYWRAGAFDDARILLGRMPNLLPETEDAPVLRASKYLHALLEGRHVHDAPEEERNELSYIWDGALGPLAAELGQAFSGRCAEALDNAGF